MNLHKRIIKPLGDQKGDKDDRGGDKPPKWRGTERVSTSLPQRLPDIIAFVVGQGEKGRGQRRGKTKP